ncbi:Kinase, NEK [Giardia duodenalis]|uniref:Kinase, NEK n=1 Tax=Giardia intestinalis (strain ATCC 50803 / WB clone C6) TaxID=184922 RepID=A8B7T5_GIAIC|nr:Kinase, NEK [Giardia intestinalis]KAE8305397.1 Kinase, NEK [Giardia intestinalis]|eukprot:XP_001708878.1 Kinase, NEK [Giardia lamblia ATCC 50803]
MKSPRILEAYDILGIIGHGPYATVFKCRHKATEETHIIKEYLLDAIPRQCISLLRREADLQAQVQIDSILQPCYTFVDHDSLVLYIVLPFLGAKTLQAAIESAKTDQTYFTEDVVWSTAYSLLTILKDLASYPLREDDAPSLKPLHCNLKPTNILFLDENLSMVQLCDCSFSPDLRLTLSSTKIGLKAHKRDADHLYTTAYMAPEILKDKKAHETSDIWSLGCILYEMCTMKALVSDTLDAASSESMLSAILPIRKLYGYSDVLNDFLNQMLTQNPSLRPDYDTLLNHSRMRALRDRSSVAHLRDRDSGRASIYSATSTMSPRSTLSTNLSRILPLKSRISTRTVELACTDVDGSSVPVSAADSFVVATQLEGNSTTPLIEAVIANDKELLIANFSYAGHVDEHGKTALMYAAELGRNEFILYLLPFENGREINGATALQLAIAAGNDDGADMIAYYECPEYNKIQDIYNDWMDGKHGAFQKSTINATFVGGRAVPGSKTPTISVIVSPLSVSRASSTLDDSIDASLSSSVSVQEDLRSPLDILSSSIDMSLPLTISRFTPSQELSTFRACASGLRGSRGLSSSELNLIFRTNSTGLMQACAANDIARAWCLRFQAGARTAEGKTALMFCAESNCILMARVLLETEAGLILRDGTSAYEVAVAHGHTVIAEILSRYEAIANSVKPSPNPVIKASMLGDISIVNYFIHQYRQAIKVGDVLQRKLSLELLSGSAQDGKTALMYAAELGNAEVVQLLRMVLARCQMTSDNHLKGRTALMFACRKNHLNCVFPLLQLEARMQDARGWTALMMASYLGYTQIIKALLVWENGIVLGSSTESSGATALMLAAEAGNVAAVSLLVNYESRRQKENGFTALMMAAQEGHSECVKILMKKEARLNRTDGWTALMSAVQRNRVECVKLLMAHEAGMSKTSGYTALMCAAQCGWEQCVRMLLPLEWHIMHSNGLTADAFAKTDTLRREMRLYIELQEKRK